MRPVLEARAGILRETRRLPNERAGTCRIRTRAREEATRKTFDPGVRPPEIEASQGGDVRQRAQGCSWKYRMPPNHLDVQGRALEPYCP